MFDRPIWLLDRMLHGRRFAFGPSTGEYTSRVLGHLYVQPGQYALSVRWDTDENARHALVKVGPVGMVVSVSRARPVAGWVDVLGSARARSGRWRGQEVHVWLNWRHIGVCFEHDQRINAVRLEVGPFGGCTLPAEQTA